MSSRMTRRRFLSAGMAGVAGMALPPAVLSANNEIGDLRVVGHHVASASWPADLKPLRIGVLSDPHHGSVGAGDEMLARSVAALNALQPDLVVLLGDYVAGGLLSRKQPVENTARILSGIEARRGIIAVLGNHDWMFDGEQVRRAFEKKGIRVLENSSARIEHDGADVHIAGTADLLMRRPNVAEAMAGTGKGDPILMLTHHPDVFANVPPEVALTLAGHTHGGQIGRSVVPSRYGARYAYGHVEEDGRHLVVSGGVGTSFLPVRYDNPPEVNLVTLGGVMTG